MNRRPTTTRGPGAGRRSPARRPTQQAAPASGSPVPSGRWTTVNLAAGVVVAGLAVGGFGYALSLLYKLAVPLVVCLVAGLVATTAWAVLRALPFDDLGALVPHPPPRPPGRAAFADLSGLEALLGSAADDQDRFDHRVRTTLSLIATDLLRPRHGLHYPAHADRIRRLVRPALWQLLTAPPGSVPTGRAQIAAWIGELETLSSQPRESGPVVRRTG